MRVFNVHNEEVKVIKEALQLLEKEAQKALKCSDEDVYEEACTSLVHISTITKKMEDYRLQELCERCLSYFWDRLVNEGVDNPDVEYLADDMGISEEELKSLFLEAGYEEDMYEEE